MSTTVELFAGANDTLIEVRSLARKSDGVLVDNATIVAEILTPAGQAVISELSIASLGSGGNYRGTAATELIPGRQYLVEVVATGPGRAEWKEFVTAKVRGFKS